jgi:hypothetical protein
VIKCLPFNWLSFIFRLLKVNPLDRFESPIECLNAISQIRVYGKIYNYIEYNTVNKNLTTLSSIPSIFNDETSLSEEITQDLTGMYPPIKL